MYLYTIHYCIETRPNYYFKGCAMDWLPAKLILKSPVMSKMLLQMLLC
jgi:hypothetical protein